MAIQRGKSLLTTRREFIQAASGSLLLGLLGAGDVMAAEDLPLIRLNLPGPGSLPFLPLCSLISPFFP